MEIGFVYGSKTYNSEMFISGSIWWFLQSCWSRCLHKSSRAQSSFVVLLALQVCCWDDCCRRHQTLQLILKEYQRAWPSWCRHRSWLLESNCLLVQGGDYTCASVLAFQSKDSFAHKSCSSKNQILGSWHWRRQFSPILEVCKKQIKFEERLFRCTYIGLWCHMSDVTGKH